MEIPLYSLLDDLEGVLLSFLYPKRVRFKCKRCALCCGDTEHRVRRILLLQIEAERISEETSIGVDAFAEEIEGSEPYVYSMKKTEDGGCAFLRDKSCSIYEIRPLTCRFYPFQLQDIGSNRYLFSYTDECPGIGRGVCLKRSFFEEMFRNFTQSMRDYLRTRNGGSVSSKTSWSVLENVYCYALKRFRSLFV